MIPATRDLLDLYFSNKQRSGGGEVESIERRTSRYWLVVMKDQRSVSNILARKHIIDEKPIRVFPYYDNFGLPYLFRPVFEDCTGTGSGSGSGSGSGNMLAQQPSLTSAAAVLASSAYRLKIKDERLWPFCLVKSTHKRLNELLAECNAASRFTSRQRFGLVSDPTTGPPQPAAAFAGDSMPSDTLHVSYVHKLDGKVPYLERMWRIRVHEIIEYFLTMYKYEKLTLSYNQWSTLCRTKQLNEAMLSDSDNNYYSGGGTSASDVTDDDDEENDDGGGGTSRRHRGFAIEALLNDKHMVKYVGNNCAILGVTKTQSSVEMSVVGPFGEVDRFINLVKDIVCEAFFTFELEEKIIRFKTYLHECECLLAKWLTIALAAEDNNNAVITPSDHSVSVAYAKRNGGSATITNKKKTSSATSPAVKLNKSRRKTINEFLNKLERDHLDMELSYGTQTLVFSISQKNFP